jgi:hypothetical protein
MTKEILRAVTQIVNACRLLEEAIINQQTPPQIDTKPQNTIEIKNGPKNSTRLIPVTKWSEYHLWPTIAGLRYYVFNEKTNGFSVVLRRVGRRVLIDEKAFFEWASKNNETP